MSNPLGRHIETFIYKILVCGFFVFFATVTNLRAQCTGGTLQGSITPTTAWQTITAHSNQYFTFPGTAGTVYEFSYCPCDGGSCTWAADLTIDSNATSSVYGNNFSTNFNADNSSIGCSTTVTWRCNANGTYRILTNQNYCQATTGLTATLAYIKIAPSVCYTVTNPAYTFDTYNSGTAFTGINIDDGWSNDIAIPFKFCFNGILYDSICMSTNGYIVFKRKAACDSIKPKANNFSSYTTYNIPFTDGTTTAFTTPGVMFPWIDAYPIGGGTIVHNVYGVTPNRHLTISYYKVPLFQCNGMKLTTQVQLYETSYKIQVNYDSVPYCASWGPGGCGTLGLVDSTGFAAVVPAGRQRSNNWKAKQQSWLFTPSCCPVNLPVQLTDFSCNGNDKGITLYWSTATETNNRYFTLQRSLDGINFSTIWQGPGAGNSEEHRNYSYLDTNTMSGINYYRLQQTDFDGKTTTFNTTSCTSGKMVAGNIFPNPASESFTVTIAPSDNMQTLTIYDLVGRAVHTESYNPQNGFENHVVHVPSLKGVYFVEITGGQQSVVRKLVLK